MNDTVLSELEVDISTDIPTPKSLWPDLQRASLAFLTRQKRSVQETSHFLIDNTNRL